MSDHGHGPENRGGAANEAASLGMGASPAQPQQPGYGAGERTAFTGAAEAATGAPQGAAQPVGMPMGGQGAGHGAGGYGAMGQPYQPQSAPPPYHAYSPPPPQIDPYWAYHAAAQAQAAQGFTPTYDAGVMAPPPYPPAPAPWLGYAPNASGYAPGGGAGHGHGAGHGARGAGMAELVDEIANGGNGLSSLSKMLNLEDSEFWKGALIGAAAVLLLTNESVQGALFKSGAHAKAAVKTGVERVKDGVEKIKGGVKREAGDV